MVPLHMYYRSNAAPSNTLLAGKIELAVIYIYVTAEMDISAQISPARRNGFRNKHRQFDRLYEKQICSYFH